MEYKDYYQVLGVSKNSDEKEIGRATRKLARTYHPDKNPNDKLAEENFKEINETYEVLGNPDNRAKYDRLGVNYHRFRQMGGNPGDYDFSQWFSRSGGEGSRVDLGDIFGDHKGMPHSHQKEFVGDLMARIQIRIPQQISPAARDLYQKLASLAEIQPA